MNKREIITKAKVMMWSYLVIFEALKIFGFDFGIRVENERLLTVFNYIDNNLFLYLIINAIMCYVVYIILFSMCISNYTEHKFAITLYILIYSTIIGLCGYYNIEIARIVLGVVSHAVLIVASDKKLHAFKVVVIDNIFTLFATSIKNVDVFEASLLVSIFYLSDYYVLLILYKIGGFEKWRYFYHSAQAYLVKKLKNLKDKFRNYKWKLSVVKSVDYGKKLKLEKLSLKNLKLKLRIWKMKLKLKSRDTAIPIITVYLIFLITVVLSDKGIESALFLIPYLAFRKSFNKTFHADYIPNIRADKIIQTCTILSSLMFVIAISNLLPIEVSLFSGIVVAFCFDWFLWMLKDWLDLRIENKELKEKHKEKKFELTHDGIVRIFKEFKTPEKYREYLTDVLIGGIKDTDYFSRAKEIIDEQQFRNYKYRFSKKLKTLDLL